MKWLVSKFLLKYIKFWFCDIFFVWNSNKNLATLVNQHNHSKIYLYKKKLLKYLMWPITASLKFYYKSAQSPHIKITCSIHIGFSQCFVFVPFSQYIRYTWYIYQPFFWEMMRKVLPDYQQWSFGFPLKDVRYFV